MYARESLFPSVPYIKTIESASLYSFHGQVYIYFQTYINKIPYTFKLKSDAIWGT